MTCGIINGGTLKYPGNLGASASNSHPRNIDRNLPGPDQPHQNSYSPTPTAPPPPTTPGGPDSGLDQDSATLNNPSLL
ncbi:hypothetical protein TWF569_000824 [Orbilia oligospora]|uniref:Uncharacterized protein n=1 Tax=Orbilia oligospora TaxID=2813651 RepID=A0A7C8JTA7_ORBOL|nr:hypothetical protein TWF102_001955 [Orbilia oligospora]KAF3125382.1 hypothetical protein TWF569_000824 [Orbilia oligospora]KAF3138517.1 hypothetical protein TWF703_004564 [Orbilia oligospora]KAF3140422.1 hypothetical protein TWF594_006391 [Orbilia oligospora]